MDYQMYLFSTSKDIFWEDLKSLIFLVIVIQNFKILHFTINLMNFGLFRLNQFQFYQYFILGNDYAKNLHLFLMVVKVILLFLPLNYFIHPFQYYFF